MNDYHMITLANDITAQRLAEAARSRKARPDLGQASSGRPGHRSHGLLGGPRTVLTSVLHRVALF